MSALLEVPHPRARDRALFVAGKCTPADLIEGALADFTAYDDVTPGLIPSDATHCSYYGNGPFANLGPMRAACPHAILSPCLLRQPVADYKQYDFWEHGLSIDVEPSLFTPAEAASIAASAKRQGVMPRVYFPLSWAGEVVAELNAAGLKRGDVQLHTAHWTGVPHICSGITGTAWGTIAADQTQYWDQALGRSLDANLCHSYAYGPWGKPAPQPSQKYPTGQARAELTIDYSKPVGHRISVHGTHGSWVAGLEQELELMQVSFDRHGNWRIAGVPNTTKPLG